jgi:hypothetical protein
VDAATRDLALEADEHGHRIPRLRRGRDTAVGRIAKLKLPAERTSPTGNYSTLEAREGYRRVYGVRKTWKEQRRRVGSTADLIRSHTART